jgi:Holliday junction resolvase RusA-like endonuclease
MFRIFLESLPQAKKRHRSGLREGRIVTYDPQHADKIKTKWLVAKLFRDQGLLKPILGPVEVWLSCYYPAPKTWSKKRLKEEKLKTSRPDVDNNIKFYFDVMNGIAYKDDAQVVEVWSEKRYSDKPGIEIYLIPKEVSMVHEHAITIHQNCSIEQISFLVKKANRLGKMNREIHNIFSTDDDDGSHIIFEVDEMTPKHLRA